MSISSRYFSILCIILLFACQAKQEQAAPKAETNPLDFAAIADKLIARMDLQREEKVLLVGLPGRFDPLVDLLADKIQAKGATYLGALSVSDQNPTSWSTDFTDKSFKKSKEELVDLFAEVDLGVMLPGAVPTHLPYKVLQEQLDRGQGRTIHFHWAGAYDLNGNLLEMDDNKDQFYQTVLLNTDYSVLASSQQAFEAAMRGKTIRVTTPAGTDISFSIGDRPVAKQDGNASAARAAQGKNLIDREVELPAGAIRVAPIEETVKGTIVFPDAVWNGEKASGVKMSFTEGKLSQLEVGKGKEAVEAEIEAAGDAGRSFREFALGMNPLLSLQAVGSPWIPYYGYGAGIVRLSLGENTELGGKVGGGYVRWNFFIDATVTVGDEVWVKDGELVK